MSIATVGQRMRGPLAGAAVMSGLIAIGLWTQHARGAWPFDPVVEAAPAAAAPDRAAESPSRAGIPAGGDVYRQLGIATEPARVEGVSRLVRAVATIAPDETRISHVHTRVSGWIEQLDINTTGERVSVGQPVARIFSPELLSSQTEYLAARRGAAGGLASAVVESGRTRLGVLGMSGYEIDAIEREGTPMRLVTVTAPRGGVVVRRAVTVGTSVDPSMELLTIADLSRVWVMAEIPESDIRDVRVGSVATLEFAGAGITSRAARVEFVYPTLSEDTRTLRVRMSVSNASGGLKPGMFGAATFDVRSGRMLTVPRDALVDTGTAQHVFVAERGMFMPRSVRAGARMADRVEILSGLEEGEQVVSSGVFLLDSESRLQASGGAGPHQHGTPADEKPKSAAPAPAPRTPAAKPASKSDPHAGHR